jgi:hypothetical protein
MQNFNHVTMAAARYHETVRQATAQQAVRAALAANQPSAASKAAPGWRRWRPILSMLTAASLGTAS